MMKQKTNRSARPLTVRLLCAMLCALLAAGILAGCGKKTSDTPKPSGTAGATVTDAPTDTEPADSSDDLDDSYHFDRDFIILSRESTAGEFDSTSAISGDDVANAIYDGTSAIMLSGETAAGRYPVESVKTMDAIARRTESDINHVKRMAQMAGGRNRLSVAAATAHAACTTAQEIGADAILTVSQRGTTARLVSRFHPGTPIIACLLDQQVRRQMALYWGVEPIMMPYASSTDELVDFAVQAAAQAGVVHEGDLVVVTAGVPVGVAGTTNMIRIQQVGGALVNAVGIGEKKASGPLCICRSTDEVAEKFQPGDVLVVPYTTNELLPYIRQAAAVITEEASVECHTATIGLALDKPVIVGAAGAVQRLTDGTMVTVDCARGLVRAMP